MLKLYQLLDDPKHLFVRLFLRNQKYWFRQSKLEGHYREIDDLESSIRQLITTGLLMDQESVTVPAEVLGILAMDELKILCRRIGIKEKLSGKPVCLIRLVLQKAFVTGDTEKRRSNQIIDHVIRVEKRTCIDYSGPLSTAVIHLKEATFGARRNE